METPKFKIKNYRGTRGIEGPGFTYDLYVNEALACHVSDWGDGGPTAYQWVNEALKVLTLAYVASLPDGNLNCMMADLEEDHLLQAKIAKMCKTRAVFTLPTDPWGTIRHIKAPYGPKVREHILAKYPDATIHNV